MRRHRVEQPTPILVQESHLFLNTWFWVCPMCGDRATFSTRTARQSRMAGQRHIEQALKRGRCPGGITWPWVGTP